MCACVCATVADEALFTRDDTHLSLYTHRAVRQGGARHTSGIVRTHAQSQRRARKDGPKSRRIADTMLPLAVMLLGLGLASAQQVCVCMCVCECVCVCVLMGVLVCASLCMCVCMCEQRWDQSSTARSMCSCVRACVCVCVSVCIRVRTPICG
jgi:hypothetical protein